MFDLCWFYCAAMCIIIFLSYCSLECVLLECLLLVGPPASQAEVEQETEGSGFMFLQQGSVLVSWYL